MNNLVTIPMKKITVIIFIIVVVVVNLKEGIKRIKLDFLILDFL